MLAEYYDIDGQLIETGSFCLVTKSLSKAAVDVEDLTGFKCKLMSFNFCVMAKENKRIVISADKG